MGLNGELEKIKQALKVVKESLKELESVEYVLELFEKELNEYRSLIDKESFIPKARFVKQRIGRLIERMRYVSDENLACVVVKLSLQGEMPPAEQKSIIDYIATYIDGHVRPSDLVFKVEEDIIGIIFALKNKADLDVILRRLDTMLLNLKAKTYSSSNILLNYKMKSFYITSQCNANDVIERCKKEVGEV